MQGGGTGHHGQLREKQICKLLAELQACLCVVRKVRAEMKTEKATETVRTKQGN